MLATLPARDSRVRPAVSIHALAQQPVGQGHAYDADQRHRPELRKQHVEVRAFEKKPAQHDQEIAQRIGTDEGLHRAGREGDGRGEGGLNHHRQHEQLGVEQALRLGQRQSGNGQAGADR